MRAQIVELLKILNGDFNAWILKVLKLFLDGNYPRILTQLTRRENPFCRSYAEWSFLRGFCC